MVMKYRYILMLAALLLSCSKVNDSKELLEPQGGTVILNASLSFPDTRIHFAQELDNYTEARWEDGDCIWVRSDTQPYWENGDRFVTNAAAISEDGHSAAFTGRTRTDGKTCAIYPYAMVAPGSDNSTILLDVPAEYPMVKNDCPVNANAAAAFWDDGRTKFSMSYIFGALKLSLTGNGQKISRLEIQDNASNALWGTMRLTPDYSAGNIASMEMINGDAKRNRVALTMDNVSLGSEALECYFLLPEGSLASGFILKITEEDGSVVALSSTKADNAIVRGKVVRMPVADIAAAIPYDSGEFKNGSGSKEDPYQLATADDLIMLSGKLDDAVQYSEYSGKYYLQTADIDMSGKSFSPIGASSDKPFTGHYDGAGKKISLLSTQGSSSDNPASGVFGYVDAAEICGITAENRTNIGSYSMVGGIVGNAVNSTIKDCKLIGSTLEASSKYCGGIVAKMSGGLLSGCSIEGVNIVNSANYAGGIVGEATDGTRIENCLVSGNSSVSAPNEVGGIGGHMVQVSMNSCRMENSSVNTDSEDAGGLAGWFVNGNIEGECVVSAAKVSAGTNYAGGIVGLLEKSTLSGCKVLDGTVVTVVKNCAGGIVGYMKKAEPSVLDTCTLSAASKVGGNANIGGICGWMDTGTLRNCLVDGQCEISADKDGAGGIIGRAISKGGTDNLIDGCVFSGASVVSGAYSVGGILGYAYPDANGPVVIINSSLQAASVRTTSCDTGADPAKGDCMSAGIVGRMRLSDSGSIGKIINCSVNIVRGGFPCDLPMSHPSVGAFIGYGHITSEGSMQVINCCTNMLASDIVLAGNPLDAGSNVSQVGVFFGKLPNSSVIKVSHNYGIDSGLSAGETGSNTEVSDNMILSESVFKDGSTVCADLNSYVSGCSDYTLRSWAVGTDGLPYLSE